MTRRVPAGMPVTVIRARACSCSRATTCAIGDGAAATAAVTAPTTMSTCGHPREAVRAPGLGAGRVGPGQRPEGRGRGMGRRQSRHGPWRRRRDAWRSRAGPDDRRCVQRIHRGRGPQARRLLRGLPGGRRQRNAGGVAAQHDHRMASAPVVSRLRRVDRAERTSVPALRLPSRASARHALIDQLTDQPPSTMSLTPRRSRPDTSRSCRAAGSSASESNRPIATTVTGSTCSPRPRLCVTAPRSKPAI